jgi:chromosome segregation ATPase
MAKAAVSEAPDEQGTLDKLNSVRLKRQVTIKSIVNDSFRDKAKTEFSEELKLIDSQLEQLENQYLQMLKQLEGLARQGQNVQKQLDQLNMEAQEKRTQLAQVKMTVSQNLANLDRVNDGGFAVTGVLESYVDVKVGDNIYDKIRGAEMIIEDGIVKEIIG